MSIARENVSDSSEGSIQSDDAGVGAEKFEFFCEMYLTVGVAGTVFMATLITTMNMVGNSIFPIEVYPIPIIGFVACSIISGIISQFDMSQISSEDLKMHSIVVAMGWFIIVFVIGVLQISFIDKVPATMNLNVSILSSNLKYTPLATAIPTGFLIGQFIQKNVVTPFLYSLLFSLAGAIVGLVIF